MVRARRAGGGDYSRGVRGWGGEGGWAIIQGRRLFQIIPPKRGDYSRGAINRGAAIIRGNTVTCIVQVTFKFENKTLLVHNRWLSFAQFKILFDFVADKYRLDNGTNLLTQVFELST